MQSTRFNQTAALAILIAGSAAASAGTSPTVAYVNVPASLSPGQSASISLVANTDTTGAGDGIFGTAGFYLFAGDSIGTGPGAASGVGINPALSAAVAPGNATGASVLRVGAARGLQPGLLGSPVPLMTFTITASPTAQSGDVISFRFEGDIVLDQNGSLETFGTTPGINQGTLPLATADIPIAAGCNIADIAAEFGTLNVNDVIEFVNGFNAQLPIADISPPGGDGTLNVNDVIEFVNAFNAGCP